MSSFEKVINKALSGLEIKEILLRDFKKLLDNEGFLTNYVAYGRISWQILLKLNVDNHMMPESKSSTESRFLTDSGVDNFPLSNPENDESRIAIGLERNITSPNVERIRNGMPVPAEIKQHDGTTGMENILYPESAVEDIPEDMKIKDQDWGMKL